MTLGEWSGGRLSFALRYASRHLLISMMVAAAAAVVVFRMWYPGPAASLLGVGAIYLVLLSVDVVCGPVLTLVLAAPHKRKRELRLDLTVVALIQLAALGYGLMSLESARPLAYVFEMDRLVLVGQNETYLKDCPNGCPIVGQAQGIGRFISDPNAVELDRMQSLDLSLQGVSPARRPGTWREWNWEDPRLRVALRPLNQLREEEQRRLASIKGKDYVARPDLRFLPLVSSKTLDWIAVFDVKGVWIDSLQIDGFR